MTAKDIIELHSFSDFSIDNPFFTSLANDYVGFEKWFNKKSSEGAKAFTLTPNGKLQGFMYIKKEDGSEPIELVSGDIISGMPRFKIGTFKFDSHGTILGDRFLAFALRQMLSSNKFVARMVYVTVFPKHVGIFKLFKRFGFIDLGEISGKNGEHILVKGLYNTTNDAFKNFPRIDLRVSSFYNLAIKAEYHDEFFPEGRLSTDKETIPDNQASNTVVKTYLTAMGGVDSLEPGDLITIYRTGSSSLAPANYSSVITGVGTVLEYRNLLTFQSYEEFTAFIGKGTIFSDEQLRYFWNTKRFVHVVKFLYNFSFPKRPTLKYLRDNIFINHQDPKYHGFYQLTKEQFKKILIDGGEVSERFIID